MHINPMLNEKKRDVSRRTRSDKKRDIKIPVTKEEKGFIIMASIERKESETDYCTQLLKSALLEEQITYYAVLWGWRSVRKVAHRIFMQSLRLERGEIIIEGI